MSYLLPCPKCAHQLKVEAGQAGQLVRCSCGEQLEVPTMRSLSTLARSDDPDREEDLAPLWSAHYGVITLGLIIAAGALAFSLYLNSRASLSPPIDFSRELNKMAPAQTWELWSNVLRHGTRKWVADRDQQNQILVKRDQEVEIWERIGYGIAAVGVLLAIAAFFNKPRNARAAASKRISKAAARSG